MHLQPYIRDTPFLTTVRPDIPHILGMRFEINSATVTPSRNVGVHFPTRCRCLRALCRRPLELLLGSSRSFQILRCDRVARLLRCMGRGVKDQQSSLT